MDQELKKLIKKNLELTRENRETVRYIKKFIIWQQILGAVKVLLIAIPIVLGVLYLPPFVEDIMSRYQGAIDLQGSSLPEQNILNGEKEGEKISPELLECLEQCK